MGACTDVRPVTGPRASGNVLDRAGHGNGRPIGNGAESVLTCGQPEPDLPAETARWSTITQIYQGTYQIQRMVLALQLLKG